MKNLSLNKFADEVLEVMPLMFREFARREDNALARGKISCPQMVALTFAAERGEVTVGEIARVLSSEKSSASVLLERLVKQGMMRRRHDQKDRRLVWISLTPKGRRVIGQILTQKKESLKAIFGKITPAERIRYLGVLRKVRTNLLRIVPVLLLAVLFSAQAYAFQWPWQKAEEKPPVKLAEPASPAGPDLFTLQKAFAKALKRSESVAITAEEIQQARSRFYRSFDYFLPQVRYHITRFEQDVDDDISGGESGFDFGRRTTPQQKFVFSQPLFSGFKEYAAITGTGADKKEQAMKLERAKELLFIDVMESYYTVLNTEKDLRVLYEIHRLLTERLREVRERVDLGRSREGEAKTSLSDIKILEADLLDAKRRVRAARNLLEFYTGEPLDGNRLSEDNGEMDDLSEDISGSQSRADVIQFEQAFVVAEKKVISARSNLFPTVSLDGNYYTERVGFQEGNDWDVTLRFDVPVFEFGQTAGDITEANSNREKARLAWEEKKRLARLEARDAYEDYAMALKAEKALAKAEGASRENYNILRREYTTNLVNNLDVLDGLRRYQETVNRYDNARYATRKNYWKLKAAVGDLPQAALEKMR